MFEVIRAYWALIPAIAFAIWLATMGFPRLLNSKFMNTIADVEWVKELVMHSAYYGTVVAASLGYKKEAHETAILAGIWFVAMMTLSRLLTNRLVELEDHELRTTHRKNAGMTRDVVRYEVKKALEPKAAWTD